MVLDRKVKRTYSIKEASVYSGIKPKTWYYLIDIGVIEAIKIGKITLLDGDDLDNLLDKNKGFQKKRGKDVNDLIKEIISADIKPCGDHLSNSKNNKETLDVSKKGKSGEKQGNYYIKVRFDGIQKEVCLGTANKRQADKNRAKVIVELAKGKFYGFSEGNNKTFYDLAERYLRVATPKKSGKSQERDRGIFSKHLIPSFGKMLLKKITSAHVSKYKEKREETNNEQNGKRISPDTVDKELALLKAVFEVAVREWKWIEINPATGVNVENTGKPRIRYLTGEEIAMLYKACKTWLKHMVVVAHFTGMRRGNLICLEWSHVDLFQRQITLPETKNDEPLAIPMCKNLYELFVSLSKVRHINSKYVFHNADGSPIKPEKLRKAFKTACKKAKIENFRWHDLRHQFASELVQNGVPLYEVQKLLGHKSIKVTEKYAHLAPSNLRNAIKAFDRKRDANFGRNTVEINSRKFKEEG